MNDTIDVEGVSSEVLERFEDGRVLVRYEGEYIFSDLTEEGWIPSPVPAKNDVEMAALRKYTDPLNDVTTVTVVPE